jgi:7-cyano-7-deazaguanine tRNA-ribosyltransferase
MLKFEIKDRDASGRICKMTTVHGNVITPNLMPVINPNKLLISPKEMRSLFGTEIIITNSYIVFKDKELHNQALNDGIHKLIDFDGPIMTDSGTFQSYMYGKIDLDPLKIVEFQRDIDSDIGTILDIFGKPDQTRQQAEAGVKETIKRAEKSAKLKKNMNLACPVQGSVYPDLRTNCAKELGKIDSDFFPIGGVVPLMENQRYKDLVSCIIASKKGLPPNRPVHLFGAGHPLIFPLAVALGCDLFDSSAYAKYAEDGRMIFPYGTKKLENLAELPCCCPVCSNFTAKELKDLDDNVKKLQLAKHNLYVSFTELKNIRTAITEGTLWELVEQKARANPYLLESLKILRKNEHKEWLEKFEPTSKNRALFYTGSQTLHRPIIYRNHQKILKRFNLKNDTLIVLPEGKKPYSSYYEEEIKKIWEKNNELAIIINSHLGPVPLEIDEMYPFAQCVFPDMIDRESSKISKEIFEIYTKEKNVIFWHGSKSLEELEKPSKKTIKNIDLKRIEAVIKMQFGIEASNILYDENLNIVKSKKTGKIRNIYFQKKHILSMRASDGMFTLKKDGALILHKYLRKPKLRVIIDDDAVPFVGEGKSVFAKFVLDCDSELRPFDECLIVDKNDTLLAVGRTLLNKLEMKAFEYGVAVKTREHFA